MKRHVKTHIKYREVKEYPCNECNQVFYRQQNLRNHKDSHRPPIMVACEFCGKLITKRHYHAHLVFHRARKHQCPFAGCTKKYFKKPTLASHIENRHEESKNIKCPECSSVFLNEGRMKRHMSRSHAEPSFFCEIEGCNYKGTRKDRYKQHIRKHEDIDASLRDALLNKLVDGRSKPLKTENK